MTGKYREGLTEGTPRRGIRREETPRPFTSELLAEVSQENPPEIEITWKDRMASALGRFASSRLTESLNGEEAAMMASGQTTWVGIIKVLIGVLGTVLAGSGIDVHDGALVVASGTAPMMIVFLIGYFVLSGVQAFLTQDRSGGTGKTTVVGIIKAAAGTLGTVLMALGVNISESGSVTFDPSMSIWVIGLYLAYLILSAVQATLSKDRMMKTLAATPL